MIVTSEKRFKRVTHEWKRRLFIEKRMARNRSKINKQSYCLRDLFLFYPYKCQDIYVGNTVPIPYVKKEDIDCNNKHSLKYREWRNIVEAYLRILSEYIIQGNTYELPDNLGDLKMTKGKFTRNGFITENGKRKRVRFQNLYAHGYSPFLRWIRATRNTNIPHRKLFRIIPLKTFANKIRENIDKDHNRILLYDD